MCSCFWCLLLDLLLQSMCLCLGFCCCALVHDVLCLGFVVLAGLMYRGLRGFPDSCLIICLVVGWRVVW